MKKKMLAVDYAASIMSRGEYLAEVKSGKPDARADGRGWMMMGQRREQRRG